MVSDHSELCQHENKKDSAHSAGSSGKRNGWGVWGEGRGRFWEVAIGFCKWDQLPTYAGWCAFCC